MEKLPIWGDIIPGNTGESKLTVIHPDESLSIEECMGMPGGIWDKSTPDIISMVGDDTVYWKTEVENGDSEETFSDVPYIVPYIVEGAKKCVIVVPGGAYLFKSMDNEGEDIAAFLNAAGISCFVLWYRSYPYRSPYMYLDLQRAIRYVRYHASEYGIDPKQIATVGFSAGGNLAAMHAVSYGNKPIEEAGYSPDEIDKMDGQANAVGLIYPAVQIYEDKIIACIGGLDTFRNEEARKPFALAHSMAGHIDANTPPLFLCNALDDEVVPPATLFEVIEEAHKKGVKCEVHMFPYGGHGFGGCVERPNPFGPAPDFSAVNQWKELFVKWINNTL